MPGHGRKDVDDRLLLCFASGASASAAAAQAGCSERTARRRLEDKAFRERVKALRGEMVANAAGRLAASMLLAADRLRELLQARSETVCLGAARSLIELGAKLRESAEIEQRLAQVEEALRQREEREKRR
jgi:hypothetical protein